MEDHTESNEGTPDAKSVFEAAVDNIKSGKAHLLPSFDPDTSMKQLGELDATLTTPYIDKTKLFLNYILGLSSQTDINDVDEKLKQANIHYKSKLDVIGEDYLTAPITLQSMCLGALVFAGMTDNVPNQEKKTELEELNQFLSGNEQAIIKALIAGIRLGFGERAKDILGRLKSKIDSLTKSRTGKPEKLGDDFTEALLVTKL